MSVIELIIFWTGFVAVQSFLLFVIVFFVWHTCVWIEKHNKWYFYAVWIAVYHKLKRLGNDEPTSTYYWNNKKYRIEEVK